MQPLTVGVGFFWIMLLIAFAVGLLLAEFVWRGGRFAVPKLVKRVRRHEVMPRGYGVAWVEFIGNEYVCMPMPFNAIAGLLRSVVCAIRYPDSIAADSHAAYFQGRRDTVDRDIEVRRLRADLSGAYRLLSEVADRETVEPEPGSLVSRIDRHLFEIRVAANRQWLEG